MKFFKEYYDLIKNVISIDRENDEFDDGKLKWFDKNLGKFKVHKEYQKIDNIIKSFLFAEPLKNIYIRNDSYESKLNSYISLDNDNPVKLETKFRGSNELITSVKYFSSVILAHDIVNYSNDDEQDDLYIKVISNINLKWLVDLFPHIYNKLNLNNYEYRFNIEDDDQQFKRYKKRENYVNKLKLKIREKFNKNSLSNITDKKNTPILDEYISTIKRIL